MDRTRARSVAPYTLREIHQQLRVLLVRPQEQVARPWQRKLPGKCARGFRWSVGAKRTTRWFRSERQKGAEGWQRCLGVLWTRCQTAWRSSQRRRKYGESTCSHFTHSPLHASVSGKDGLLSVICTRGKRAATDSPRSAPVGLRLSSAGVPRKCLSAAGTRTAGTRTRSKCAASTTRGSRTCSSESFSCSCHPLYIQLIQRGPQV